LVAPLSANTLAKLSAGLCDNLVTLVFRCWDMKLNSEKTLVQPIILCPAMNNLMYANPFTGEHLEKMGKLGCTIIDSIEKVLMCG
jgi:phosphopantothenoylcysteine synthetase/decarboxylase